MQFESLSDHDLTSALDLLAAREREATVELLRYLSEFDSRGLYREVGYSSLFDYCVRRLKFSERSAYRRVAAAKALRNNPELGEHLRNGDMTLCSVSAAAKSLEKKVTAVSEIVGCSKREVELIVARSNPVPSKPRECIKPLVVHTPANLVEAPKREERIKLEFSVKKEVFERFRAIQAELSIEAGKQLSVEAVFERFIADHGKVVSKRLRVRTSAMRASVCHRWQTTARVTDHCCKSLSRPFTAHLFAKR